jgi:hypothetical protein
MKKTIFFLLFISTITVGFSQTTWKEENINKKNTIKVFPNPATNVINVLSLKNDRNAFISITDTYGNQVISHQWDIRNNALNIPITNLEKGIYLIRIQSEHQKVQAKFIKQ